MREKLFCLLPLAIVCFITSMTVSAQTWHSYSSTNQLTVEYSDPVNCTYPGTDVQAEIIFLKFTNLTGAVINVTFRADQYYTGEGCITCGNNEYQYSIVVPANQSVSAGCNSLNDNRKLTIFKKYTNRNNPRTFDHFEITGIQIN